MNAELPSQPPAGDVAPQASGSEADGGGGGEAAWNPTVVLRHDLPDGTHHFDWLIARTPDPIGELGEDARVLLTFRLALMPDWARLDHPVDAVRIPDHRARYLTYEGAVSENRGTVTCEAEGVCRIETLDDEDGYLRLQARLVGKGALLVGTRLAVTNAESRELPCRPGDSFESPMGVWRFGAL